MTSILPFGSWPSPLTADRIAAGAIRLKGMLLDEDDLYWLELRPAERGRYVIVRQRPNGLPEDVTPASFDARSRVHEYGGGSFTVHNSVVYFVNSSDQRIYKIDSNPTPVALTPPGRWRYADLVVDVARRRLIAVGEEHVDGREPINRLVAISLDGIEGGPDVLAEGHDFYASPRLSPDGTRLAWIAWRHPLMPWDGSELWTGIFDENGAFLEAELCTGGENESIFQPEWSPEGVLHFVSDRTGWWNLYRWTNRGAAEPLFPAEAEFGLPQWVFGQSTYGFPQAPGYEGRLIVAYCESGQWRLGLLDPKHKVLEPVATPYTEFDFLRVSGKTIAFIGGAPTQAPAAVTLTLDHGVRTTVHRTAFEAPLPPEGISVAEPIAFPTAEGRVAYGYYYAPKHPAVIGPDHEKPPLLVICHGGPTGATSTSLRLEIQYWTSRGIGVVDVNYGGSTGYGRAYRERLRGQWGIVDVDDCVNAAKFLVTGGAADEARCAIRGGSAGGYTTLAALAFRDFFRAGANYYGVSDLEALMRDTHKFESKYDRFLVGPYPQAAALYRERSPIHHLDKFHTPLLVLQGLEDKVVPPNQSELIVEALRKKQVPVAYLAFPGEQHGFLRAENIKRSLEAELYFYGRVFGFNPADKLEPLKIENM